MNYNQWDKVTLTEVTDKIGDGLHGTPKYDDLGEYYFVNGNNLNGNITIDNLTKRVSHSEYLKHKKDLNNKTILLSINGTLGKLAFYKGERVILGKSACYINVKNEVDKRFIFYTLQSTQFLSYLGSHSSGTTIKNLGLKEIRNFSFSLPNYSTQKAIANILSSLDDKIELNNKINKNLEELAQTLYKQWFVDFDFPNVDGEPYKSSGGEMVESELGLIPKGWRISKLDELLNLVKESTKPGEHLQDRIYVPIDTLQSKHLVLSDHKPYTDANSSLILFDRFDILMGAMRVYFHKVNLSFNQGVTRTTTFVLRSKSIYEVPFNLLTINQDVAIDYANGTSKGSTMPYAVWENALNRYEIVNPNIEVKKKFFNHIMPILQILNNNNIQNYKLQKTRDELLPKLMNGEIEVPIEE